MYGHRHVAIAGGGAAVKALVKSSPRNHDISFWTLIMHGSQTAHFQAIALWGIERGF